MTTVRNPNSLRYIGVALSQMAALLRRFQMQEPADLLEKARAEIDETLKQPGDKAHPS